jgi:sulfotransferase famil protein
VLSGTSNETSDLVADAELAFDSERFWKGAARELVARTKAFVREELTGKVLRASPPKVRRAAGRLFGIPIPRYLWASQYLFIHIPKNAGVSISQAIYGRQVWHRPASYFLDSDPEYFSSRISFAVVRNPWDRLVSAYEYQRFGGTAIARLSRDTTPPRAQLRSFEAFVLDYVFPNKRRLDLLDNVLREQHTFVNDRDGKRLVNFLGRFEDMTTLERRLSQDRAIRTPLGHLNKSPGRVLRDYRRYYTSHDLVDAVAACYARDIDEFSYQF